MSPTPSQQTRRLRVALLATSPAAWKWTGRAVGAAILLSWLWAALHSELWVLLAFLSVLAGAGWALRRRRDIVVSVLAATVTAVLPTFLVIHEFTNQAAAAGTVAAVLTGHTIAAPVPTILAWTLRPILISRAVNSLIGSGILLLATGLTFAAAGRWGAAPLTAALVLSCAVVVHRHRRAWDRRIADLPVTDGWTDLGHRAVPSGTPQLFVGRGRAITALTVPDEQIPHRVLRRAMQHAIDTAVAIGVPPYRVQPIVIATHEGAPLGAHAVSSSHGRCTVLVTTTGQIPDIQRSAPGRRFRPYRRALYAAAALPIGQKGDR